MLEWVNELVSVCTDEKGRKSEWTFIYVHIALIREVARFLFLFFLIHALFILALTWKCFPHRQQERARESVRVCVCVWMSKQCMRKRFLRWFKRFMNGNNDDACLMMTWNCGVDATTLHIKKKSALIHYACTKGTALKISFCFCFCFHFTIEHHYVAHKTHNSS